MGINEIFMKRYYTLLAVLCGVIGLSTQFVSAQHKNFYVKPSFGTFLTATPGEFPNVGSSQPRETMISVNASTGAQTVVSEKTLTGSFGSGARTSVTFGWNLKKGVAFEVGATYFNGDSQTMMKKTATIAGTSTMVLSVESMGKAKAVELAPALVAELPFLHKIKPYTRVGLILPVYGDLTVTSKVSDLTGAVAATVNPNFKAVELTRTEKISPNPTIGFISGLGLNIPVTPHLGITAELEYRSTPVRSKSKEITAFSATGKLANGTAVPVSLTDLPNYVKNVNYVEELNATSNVYGNTGFDATKPGNELTSYINIGGLGTVIGIKWTF